MTTQTKTRIFVLIMFLVVAGAGSWFAYKYFTDPHDAKITEWETKAEMFKARADSIQIAADDQHKTNLFLLADRDERIKLLDSLLYEAQNAPKKTFEKSHAAVRNNSLQQDIKFFSNRVPKANPYH